MSDTVNLVDIGLVQRMNVKPGECLLVTMPKGAWLADGHAQQIKDTLRAQLPEGVGILLTSSDVGFTVIPKPRHLPERRPAYSDEQWADLEQWLTSLGQHVNNVADVSLSDTEVTITLFKRNADGKLYAIGDDVAKTYITVPLSDAPAWFSEVAG